MLQLSFLSMEKWAKKRTVTENLNFCFFPPWHIGTLIFHPPISFYGFLNDSDHELYKNMKKDVFHWTTTQLIFNFLGLHFSFQITPIPKSKKIGRHEDCLNIGTWELEYIFFFCWTASALLKYYVGQTWMYFCTGYGRPMKLFFIEIQNFWA